MLARLSSEQNAFVKTTFDYTGEEFEKNIFWVKIFMLN